MSSIVKGKWLDSRFTLLLVVLLCFSVGYAIWHFGPYFTGRAEAFDVDGYICPLLLVTAFVAFPSPLYGYLSAIAGQLTYSLVADLGVHTHPIGILGVIVLTLITYVPAKAFNISLKNHYSNQPTVFN